MKALGYGVLRVRHHGELGRLELAADDLERPLAQGEREAIERAIRSAGYARAELDPRPFRSGRSTASSSWIQRRPQQRGERASRCRRNAAGESGSSPIRRSRKPASEKYVNTVP